METIKCKDCWKEVIKRTVNHTMCMDCTYKRMQRNIKKLYDLDMRNMSILETRDDGWITENPDNK